MSNDEPEMVPVLRTNDQSLLAFFQAALQAAEIPYFIRGAEASSLMALPAVVVVPAACLEDARALLESAQIGDASDQGDDDEMG